MRNKITDSRVEKGVNEAKKILKTYNHSLFIESQLEVLKLRSEGLTLEEIAIELGITRQAVDSKFGYIREKIEKL